MPPTRYPTHLLNTRDRQRAHDVDADVDVDVDVDFDFNVDVVADVVNHIVVRCS